MAVIQNYINTKDKEKVGNVQCYKQWGMYILRTTPYDAKSPAQLTQRMKLIKLTSLIHQVIDHINIAYDGLIHGSGYNANNRVLGINLKCCFLNNTTDIDPGSFVLCDNDGSFVDNVVLTSSVVNTITGTFNSNTQNDEEGEDPVNAYGFYADGNQIWHFDQSTIRKTGTITLTRPEISGLTIAIYFECLDRINLINNNPKHIIKYVGTITVL